MNGQALVTGSKKSLTSLPARQGCCKTQENDHGKGVVRGPARASDQHRWG